MTEITKGDIIALELEMDHIRTEINKVLNQFSLKLRDLKNRTYTQEELKQIEKEAIRDLYRNQLKSTLGELYKE